MRSTTIVSPQVTVPVRHAHRSVPEGVVRAIQHVRRLGLVDMYDRETVMLLAANLGYGEEMEWLVMNRHLYFEALRRAG